MRFTRFTVIATFIALTYGISWSLAGAFVFFGGRWFTSGSVILAVIYMFVPMSVAFMLQRTMREPIRQPLGISFKLNRWFVLAWLLPVGLSLATFGISLVLPGIEYSPEMTGLLERFRSVLPEGQLRALEANIGRFPLHAFWLALVQGLVAGPTVNAIAGFGEEAGWRGFLEKETRPIGFWKQSAFIGLVWGLWHAPLILQGHNYPQHRAAGVAMMTVFSLLWTPLFIYVRVKARSVIAAAVMHGSLNATAGLSMMLVKGGNDLTTGVTGLPGFVVLIAANIVLFFLLRRGGEYKPQHTDNSQ
jgi:membrane protease YdiL (CAAX protease family)